MAYHSFLLKFWTSCLQCWIGQVESPMRERADREGGGLERERERSLRPPARPSLGLNTAVSAFICLSGRGRPLPDRPTDVHLPSTAAATGPSLRKKKWQRAVHWRLEEGGWNSGRAKNEDLVPCSLLDFYLSLPRSGGRCLAESASDARKNLHQPWWFSRNPRPFEVEEMEEVEEGIFILGGCKRRTLSLYSAIYERGTVL